MNRNPQLGLGMNGTGWMAVCCLLVLSVLVQPAFVQPLFAQTVTHVSDGTEVLTDSWAKATTQRANAKPYWVVYSIEKEMCKKCLWGSMDFSGDSEVEKPLQIDELILGISAPAPPLDVRVKEAITQIDNHGSEHAQEMVIKQVALLFHMKNGAVSKMATSTMDSRFDFESEDIVWLGPQPHNQSQQFLIKIFRSMESEKPKRSLVWAVGMHDPNPTMIDFLKRVATRPSNPELSKAALFALGSTDTKESVTFLNEYLRSDSPNELRKSAIFAIGNSTHPAARDVLFSFIEWENKN